MPKLLDLTGQKIGRLTVLSRAANHNNRTAWLCRCDCGKEKSIAMGALSAGLISSCGCFQKERTSERFTKHGYSTTKLYKTFTSMIQRCENIAHPSYPDYGGRGISICPEWRNDRVAFIEWALKNGYADGLSIDRRENDDGYSPGNCRWVAMEVQANNKRSNRLVSINGETKTLSQWLKVYGVPPRTFYDRIGYGWDELTAITRPLRQI